MKIYDVKKVEFGSNIFEKFVNIFDINGNIPLQIKIDDLPIITLSLPVFQNKWVNVVELNKSNSPEIFVNEDTLNKNVIISYGQIVILKATATGNSSVKIDIFDLRPLGFEIYLLDGTLYIGTNKFSRNNFVGANTIFKLGS